MPTELPKQYDPKAAQEQWLKFWDERGYFHSRPEPNRKPFTIVMPPPNVTGALHMGHALNNLPQDVVIRFRRMQGFNALWVPGTDHAGIATQAVVEKRIREEEGKTRHDISREALVQRIWQWKDQYEACILKQLRELGCSADWSRTRFTLDPMCTRAVRETFFNFFRDGLIFRGKRLVNWDTQLQTAVADDEIYHEAVKGGFWTFRYPVKGSDEFIRFSTTRPETMLGDTAVAVHPNDERYAHLIGKTVTVPLVNREIPIIADGQLVDPALGTGAVKVTPAHDPNDYQCGLRHKLPMINILNPDGTINENGGQYAGLDRFKAREQVVAEMEKLGFFEGREDREIDLAHSDRSKTPIEPYLSDQWFVKMSDIAQGAMDAVTDGRVQFFPARYARTYLDWLGEKRDWCISRQLWWGHRIPVWTVRVDIEGLDATSYEEQLSRKIQEATDGLHHYFENRGLKREEYVLRETQERTLQFCTHNEIAVAAIEELRHSFRLYRLRPIEVGQSLEPFRLVDGVNEQNFKLLYDNIHYYDQDPIEQDPDVLDTWFSSALWPHSTLGWPEDTPELRYYYPTNVLITNRDIITLWVARMVIAGLYNTKQVPFHHVYIHPKMLDGFGEGMSKSKGNGVDPLDIIDRYGTDALRFGVVFLLTETQDSRLPVSNVCPHCDELVAVKQEHMYMRTKKITCPKCKKPFRPGGPWPSDDPDLPTAKQASERFEMGRNFANKLWNAARFLLMNLEGYTPHAIRIEELPIEDRWIISRLATTTAAVTEQLENYKFSEAARTIYDFTWSEFCDWYVEMSKGRLARSESRALAQRILAGVLDGILRLVHPIMPFVAESIWQKLNEAAFERGLPSPEPAAESVVIAPWPAYPPAWQDPAIERGLARMQELVRGVRNIYNQFWIDERSTVHVYVRCNEAVAKDFTALRPFILYLTGVRSVEVGPEITKPPGCMTWVQPDFEMYVDLRAAVNLDEAIKWFEKEKQEKEKHLQGVRAKLANPNFVERAPAEIVQQQRELIIDLEKQIQSLENNLNDLRGG